MRTFLIVLLVLVIIVALVAAALGYIGLLPGVSGLFGSDRPRDLGVSYTQADLESANSKIKTKLVSLPPSSTFEGSFRVSGSVAVNTSLTDRELTALLNAYEGQWQYGRLTDAQFRINADGTVETSGRLSGETASQLLQATGLGSGLVGKAVDTLGLGAGTPIYMKAAGSASNNAVTGQVEALQIGRISVPASWLQQNNSRAAGLVGNLVTGGGISVKRAAFANGQFQFDGTLPATVEMSSRR